MPISLLEAAKLCGLDKSTLRKAVRDGRISGTRDDTGRWWVEPCEVERIYPISSAADPQAIPRSSIPTSAPDAATDMLVTTLREALARLEKDVDRERARADQERERNDQLTSELRKLAERLALPAPDPTPETWWQKVQRIRWG